MTAALKLPTNSELREQAEALPEPLVGEVIAGELYTMGRPKPRHSFIGGELFWDLRNDQKKKPPKPPSGGWIILPEIEIVFPNDETAIPDLAGWHADRMEGHFEENPMTVVADWVCEILSPSTRGKDLGPKRQMYARHKIPFLWMIDPDEKQLDAYELGEKGRWELLGSFFNQDIVQVAPFEDVRIEMSGWWI